MSDTDKLADDLAGRARDELVRRVREAFKQAAASQGDLISVGEERLEAMVHRSVESADGVQWRRALAGLASKELGIGLGEALTHPAVARAHQKVGAPSYEAALSRLAGPLPAAAQRPVAAIAQKPAAEQSKPEAAPEPEAPKQAAPAAPAQQAAAAAPAAPAQQAAPATSQQQPPTRQQPQQREQKPQAPQQPAPEQKPAEQKPAEPAATKQQPAAPQTPAAQTSAARQQSGGATSQTPAKPQAPGQPKQTTSQPAQAASGAQQKRQAPAQQQQKPSGRQAPAKPERPAKPQQTRRPASPPPPEPEWEDEDDFTYEHEAIDEQHAAAPAPAAPARSQPRKNNVAEFDAVHVNGVASLPANERIVLRLSGEGLDLLAQNGRMVGRLGWPEIEALEVTVPHGRRRRRSGPRLLVHTAGGQARFEVPEISAEELQSKVQPMMSRYGHQ